MLYTSILHYCFNDTATAPIYTEGHTQSLHDALPICTSHIIKDHLQSHYPRSQYLSFTRTSHSAEAAESFLHSNVATQDVPKPKRAPIQLCCYRNINRTSA